MAGEKEYAVGYAREGDDIHRLVLGSSALPDIKIDYTNVGPDERAGTATKLLCAAALYCFASTLGGALKVRGAKIGSLTGKAVASKGRDDYYRTKVTDIRIEVEVAVDDGELPILEKCEKIMEQGCLITYTLAEGLRVDHVIRREPAKLAQLRECPDDE